MAFGYLLLLSCRGEAAVEAAAAVPREDDGGDAAAPEDGRGGAVGRDGAGATGDEHGLMLLLKARVEFGRV